MFRGLFSKNKKDILTFGGEIKYFGLTDWWLGLTKEERDIIRDTYKPLRMSIIILLMKVPYMVQQKLN